MEEKLFQIKPSGPKSESIAKFYEATLAFVHPTRLAVDNVDRISKDISKFFLKRQKGKK